MGGRCKHPSASSFQECSLLNSPCMSMEKMPFKWLNSGVAEILTYPRSSIKCGFEPMFHITKANILWTTVQYAMFRLRIGLAQVALGSKKLGVNLTFFLFSLAFLIAISDKHLLCSPRQVVYVCSPSNHSKIRISPMAAGKSYYKTTSRPLKDWFLLLNYIFV